MPRLPRRQFLETLLTLAVLWISGSRVTLRSAWSARYGKQAMGKDIVMLHGANCGGWCFGKFRNVFEARGWTCHTPDLIGHGAHKADAKTSLAGVGMSDYRVQMADFVKTVPEPRTLLGHSMGAVIAQQLAAEGLAEKLVLASPAPRAGILPPTAPEKQLGQDLMAIGDFWTRVIDPNFELAKTYTLNRLPADEQRLVFDRLGPESGRALFELFVWMFDQTAATIVKTDAVHCPVLCLSGTDDRIVSLETARETASAYPQAEIWELEDHAHMLLLEPGAEKIANGIVDWLS
jgi:non-heme chloroperoxidase